jgi:hypothetical protein
MKIEDLKRTNLRHKCLDEQIVEFEEHFKFFIPTEYRQLLFQSNGLDFHEPFLYFKISDFEQNQIASLYYIEEIWLDFKMLKEDVEIGSNTYFYTDCLLPIAGTLYSGARVFIGYQESYLNKIYYSDYDVLDENNIPILIKLSDSLEEFLRKYGCYEE